MPQGSCVSWSSCGDRSGSSAREAQEVEGEEWRGGGVSHFVRVSLQRTPLFLCLLASLSAHSTPHSTRDSPRLDNFSAHTQRDEHVHARFGTHTPRAGLDWAAACAGPRLGAIEARAHHVALLLACMHAFALSLSLLFALYCFLAAAASPAPMVGTPQSAGGAAQVAGTPGSGVGAGGGGGAALYTPRSSSGLMQQQHVPSSQLSQLTPNSVAKTPGSSSGMPLRTPRRELGSRQKYTVNIATPNTPGVKTHCTKQTHTNATQERAR